MSLTLRGIKGSALTHGELDNNFLWLKSKDIVGANLAGNNLVLTKDDTTTFNVDLSAISTLFTGNTSASCISDLYVTNVYGCSPITIHDSIQSIGSQSTGTTSFAFGNNVSTFGDYSHAEGSGSIAWGSSSHAEGYQDPTFGGSISIANGSHAEGAGTRAGSLAFVADSIINGVVIINTYYGDVLTNLFTGSQEPAYLDDTDFSNTIGRVVNLYITGGTFDGNNTIIYLNTNDSIYDSFAGLYIFNQMKPFESTIADTKIGYVNHSEGLNTKAYGLSSHAEGVDSISIGNYSHAQNETTIAIGESSHAEGIGSIAKGNYSHAEGATTQANGWASHAENSNNIANGNASHVQGEFNITDGDLSHAQGYYNIAVGVGSNVEGRGNISYGDRNSVGGNLSVAGAKLNYFKNVGGIYYNATTKQMNVMGDLTSNYSDGSTIYWGHSDNLATYKSVVSGSVVFVSGTITVPNTRLTYPGYSIITIYDDPTGGVNDTWAYEYGYVAVPDNTVSDYDKSNSLVFAQSSVAEKNNSLVFGYYNTSRNGGFAHGQYSIAEGLRSHAEGWLNIALGGQSHAEGFFTDSIGDRSHSEGVGTDSTGSYSHSEGGNTNSIGYASHAEGWFTTSKGQASHTEGLYTIADGNYQSVLGQYNVTGNTVQSAVIIGNGTSDLNRSNLLFAAGNEVNISGKTITTNFQMTSGATTDYILTSSDSQGNGKWTPSYNLSSKDYGSFYDTTTQTGGTGTIQSFQLNSSGVTKGISITNLTGITVTHTGIYNIQFSGQLKNDGGTKHTVFIWLRKNGLDIPNTNTGIELGNNNDNFVASWNFIEEFTSNDIINLMWYSPSNDVSILYDATPTAGPEIPSLILTITQI